MLRTAALIVLLPAIAACSDVAPASTAAAAGPVASEDSSPGPIEPSSARPNTSGTAQPIAEAASTTLRSPPEELPPEVQPQPEPPSPMIVQPRDLPEPDRAYDDDFRRDHTADGSPPAGPGPGGGAVGPGWGGAPASVGTPASSARSGKPAALLGSKAWNCRFPPEADAQKVDSAQVMLIVKVDETGEPTGVSVMRDPGNGFARAAKECALSQRYLPARDAADRPIAGSTPPITVRFTR